ESLALESFAGEPVWRMKAGPKIALVSAKTGQSLLPLNEAQIRALALSDYIGSGQIVEMKQVAAGPVEVRHRSDLWRIEFNQPKHYTLWVDPAEGRVIAHRSRLWRFYDFFWMLHIMDYQERDDFNHPLLIFFAASAFLFALSGIALLVHRFLLRPRARRKPSKSKT
ncbi:MAG: hypothetical protein COA47_18225, partial [Robiginitomaculum sp.]